MAVTFIASSIIVSIMTTDNIELFFADLFCASSPSSTHPLSTLLDFSCFKLDTFSVSSTDVNPEITFDALMDASTLIIEDASDSRKCIKCDSIIPCTDPTVEDPCEYETREYMGVVIPSKMPFPEGSYHVQCLEQEGLVALFYYSLACRVKHMPATSNIPADVRTIARKICDQVEKERQEYPQDPPLTTTIDDPEEYVDPAMGFDLLRKLTSLETGTYSLDDLYAKNCYPTLKRDREELDDGETPSSPAKKAKLDAPTYFIFGHYPGEPSEGIFYTPKTAVGEDIAAILKNKSAPSKQRAIMNAFLTMRLDYMLGKATVQDFKELFEDLDDDGIDCGIPKPRHTTEIGDLRTWNPETDNLTGIPIEVQYEY